jgi:hypothetical protein
VKPITCNFLDRNPQRCGNRQTDISVYIPRQKLGNVSCKMCEIVHMRLTPQRCGNRQTEGNREYEHGRDYLDSHVLADPSVVTRDHTPTFFFAFIRAMWRALVASCLLIPSQALRATIWARVHSSDHHVAPLGSGARFGLRVFLHASLMAVLKSFTSLMRCLWAMTPRRITNGSAGTVL